MYRSGSARLLLVLLWPLALGACQETLPPADDPSDPTQNTIPVPETQLTFIRFAPDAPPLEATVVSFWAVRGENREVKLRYVKGSEYKGGKNICLEFKVPGDALLRYPDGRTFERGDSVLITIRQVSSNQFNFQFEPAGLKFDPNSPAELRIYYDWADRDYNGDGVIDERDKQIEAKFGFWRQEDVKQPWWQISTERDDVLERARAEITGFTRYALASN